MLSEGDPGQQGRLACPGDQLFDRRKLKHLAEEESCDIGVREGPVGHAGDHRIEALRPEPVSQDLIAVTRGVRPEPDRRLVGTDGGSALEVAFEPLGLESPFVSDEHTAPRVSFLVHVEGQDLFQAGAPAHVGIRDVVDRRGLGRDRDGRPNKVRSDGDDLSADEINRTDFHDGVVRGDARGLKVDDA
jgi:hypothetical protein